MKPNAKAPSETPAPRGPRTENRRKILDVSLELFAQRGFDGVSIRDISEAADVHGATIYHYFGDKQTLYQLTQRAALERQVQDHLAIMEGPGDARVRLHAYLSNLLRSLVGGDAKRQLIERMYSDPGDRPAPFERGPLEARFKDSMKAIIRDLAPGAAEMNWEDVSGIINGLPHGMVRSRKVDERAEALLSPSQLDSLADLLTEIVIASFQVIAERNARKA